MRGRRLLFFGLATAACAAALEPLGATRATLANVNVFRTTGEQLRLGSLLPERASKDRCVVVLLRHFG